VFTKISRKIFIFATLLISGSSLFATVERVAGAQFPVRTFNSADGLIGESINRIVRDSRGFLWFCTSYGLSRFDGQEFKNYSGEQGLPSRNVNDFLESRDGVVFAATSNGLAIFDPKGKAYRWNISTMSLDKAGPEPEMFKTIFPPNTEKDRTARVIQAVDEDHEGRIFVGTATGLYRAEVVDGEWHLRRIESELLGDVLSVLEFTTDRYGYVWMVAAHGVFRIDPSKESIMKIHEKGGDSLLTDRDGQIWVTSGGEMLVGLRVFSFDEQDQPILVKTYTDKEGLKLGVFMRDIIQAANGRIYVVDGTEVYEFVPDAADDSLKFRSIVESYPTYMAEDPGGNLWIGTDDRGVIKVFLTGLKIYDETDGVGPDTVSSVFLNRSSELTITLGKQKLARYEDGKFEIVKPFGLTTRSWGNGQLDFQSVDGEWWVAAYDGLRRYPAVESFSDLSRTPPKQVFTTTDGLYTNEVFNAFGDSRGDVWFSVIYGDNALVRWEKSSGKIYRYTTEDGFPKSNGPIAYIEDLDGDIWIAFYAGGVARFRHDKFEFYGAEQGIPQGSLASLFRDSRGRIWISSLSRGIFRVEDPTSDAPTFTNLSTNDGLSTNETNCVTEDKLGAIYIGTGRGLNRIDPNSGTVKIYSRADGLPGDPVGLCRADSAGKLWFVIARKLVSMDPQASAASQNSMNVFVGGVRAGKITQPVSDLGEVDVAGLKFAADQREIQIDYFAFNYGNADRLRYQYRLNDQDWSAPSDRRTVDLNLAPGNYEFAVRAINSDGISSERPATGRVLDRTTVLADVGFSNRSRHHGYPHPDLA
jgi:ligand-binding sensor domain-containing protein